MEVKFVRVIAFLMVGILIGRVEGKLSLFSPFVEEFVNAYGKAVVESE